MPRGGARNRSGPTADPSSARSDKRGLRFDRLPARGFEGDVPEFPLRPLVRYQWVFEDKTRRREAEPDATEEFRERELEVWADAWRTPQAAAWAVQSWRWQVIAEYCRVKTTVEFEPDASAALIGQLHRFRDQIGLTPAGMKENGWQVAADEVALQRSEHPVEVTAPRSTRRLRAVDGG